MTDIVFLDIDGVLNSDSHWEMLPPDADWFQVFPENLEFFLRAMRHIRKSRDLRVVMSMSWRAAGRNKLEGYFREAVPGLAEELFAMLHPDWRTELISGPRGGEIAEWLGRHADAGRYLCIDDEETYLPGQPVLKTVAEYGFLRREREIMEAFFLGGAPRPPHRAELAGKIAEALKAQERLIDSIAVRDAGGACDGEERK